MAKKTEHTPGQFKADVGRQLQQDGPAAGAQAAPTDGARLRKLVAVVDAAADKYGPVIQTLTPAQYKIFVELAVQLINAVDDRVNPPGPAPE